MLIHDWDTPVDDAEWRSFVRATGFGHLVAAGRDRDLPVVVLTQFVFDADEVVLHLARPNPVSSRSTTSAPSSSTAPMWTPLIARRCTIDSWPGTNPGIGRRRRTWSGASDRASGQ